MARTANDVQTGVRLPAKLYEQLQEAAGARPISEEIRKRLADSFAGAGPATDDPKFRDVMAAIGQAANVSSGDYGDFGAAVRYLLAVFLPEGTYLSDWTGPQTASAALTAMGRTDLLPKLKEVSQREFDESGKSRPSDPVLYPHDYEGDKQ